MSLNIECFINVNLATAKLLIINKRHDSNKKKYSYYFIKSIKFME